MAGVREGSLKSLIKVLRPGTPGGKNWGVLAATSPCEVARSVLFLGEDMDGCRHVTPWAWVVALEKEVIAWWVSRRLLPIVGGRCVLRAESRALPLDR